MRQLLPPELLDLRAALGRAAVVDDDHVGELLAHLLDHRPDRPRVLESGDDRARAERTRRRFRRHGRCPSNSSVPELHDSPARVIW